MAIFDTIGVASIFPFITLLTQPNYAESNKLLNEIFNLYLYFNLDDKIDFPLMFGFLVLSLIIFSLLFKVFSIYIFSRYAHMVEYSVGRKLIIGYLHQTYEWFLQQNSSDVSKTILAEVGVFVNGGLVPLINMLTQSTISIALIMLLILINPFAAIIISSTLVSVYVFIYVGSRSTLKRLGALRADANKKRYNVVSELILAIKEIKLRGLENKYLDVFSKPAIIYANGQAKSYILGQAPRYILEAIVFGGAIIIILNFLIQEVSIFNVLPLISTYLFAGYRLMPALQGVYSSYASMKYSSAGIDKVYQDVSLLYEKRKFNIRAHNKESNSKLTKGIELKNISYFYPNSEKLVLHNLSCTISSKSIVGLVGKSGSGKSTFINIILALLSPQTGKLIIDDEEINPNNIYKWQSRIGYVPQQIFLSDDTVVSNIAFGVNLENIDMEAVYRASKIAEIHSFIEKDLENGYYTSIGESGSRISGGQRQRIGIARALYLNPEILILDEATSALDSITENKIINNLIKLDDRKTIILVSHNLANLKNCDKIFIFENQAISDSADFNELLQKNDLFKKLYRYGN